MTKVVVLAGLVIIAGCVGGAFGAAHSGRWRVVGWILIGVSMPFCVAAPWLPPPFALLFGMLTGIGIALLQEHARD